MSWFTDNAPPNSAPDPGLVGNGGQFSTGQDGLPRDGGANINPPVPGGSPKPPSGNTDWISQSLSDAQSTDDPDYWRRVIAADPKVAAGDQSAIDYWKMRIAQGDGAAKTRSGQQQPYGGSSYGGGASGTPGGGFGSLTQSYNTDPAALQANPGYKFMFDQGQRAVQSGAAAKGTLLTGGTLKDLATFGNGLASTYDDKFYNRFTNEQDRNFNKLYQVSNMGKPTTP